MVDLSITTTRTELADLMRDALDLAPNRVLAYPPGSLVRPCVWVESVEVGAREPGTTFVGPSMDVTIYVTADGDGQGQRETLDSYVETIWRAISLDDRYAPDLAVMTSVEEAVPFPSYRLVVRAWMF